MRNMIGRRGFCTVSAALSIVATSRCSLPWYRLSYIESLCYSLFVTFVSDAVNCAQYVMDWTPDGLKGECHQKDSVVVEVEIASLGYLQKVEGGILQKIRPMEYL